MYMKDGHRTMMPPLVSKVSTLARVLSFNPISQDITAKSVTEKLVHCVDVIFYQTSSLIVSSIKGAWNVLHTHLGHERLVGFKYIISP